MNLQASGSWLKYERNFTNSSSFRLNPPHFHVRYNDYRALISIGELKILEGNLPARILGLVIEWAELHKEELMQDWDMVQDTGKFLKINPLV